MKNTIVTVLLLGFLAAQTTYAEEWTSMPGPGESQKVTEEAVEQAEPEVVKAEEKSDATVQKPVKIEQTEEKVIVSDEKEEKTNIFGGKLNPFTLQIGTRISYFSLDDPDSGHRGGYHGDGTYLGTIYALEENQNYAPVKFFGRIFLFEYIGFEIANDSFEAATKATSYGYEGDKSDGDVTASGLTYSLVLQFPNRTKFTPYVQYGQGKFNTDFEESDHWGLGYRDPDAYADAGSPGTPLNGYTRRIDTEDVTADIFGIGFYYNVTENLLVDFSYLHTSFDVDGVFYGTAADGEILVEQAGTFPMSNYQLRLGIAYQF